MRPTRDIFRPQHNTQYKRTYRSRPNIHRTATTLQCTTPHHHHIHQTTNVNVGLRLEAILAEDTQATAALKASNQCMRRREGRLHREPQIQVNVDKADRSVFMISDERLPKVHPRRTFKRGGRSRLGGVGYRCNLRNATDLTAVRTTLFDIPALSDQATFLASFKIAFFAHLQSMSVSVDSVHC